MSDDDILGNEQRNGHMTLAKQENSIRMSLQYCFNSFSFQRFRRLVPRYGLACVVLWLYIESWHNQSYLSSDVAGGNTAISWL